MCRAPPRHAFSLSLFFLEIFQHSLQGVAALVEFAPPFLACDRTLPLQRQAFALYSAAFV
jgi:hypothetical protein